MSFEFLACDGVGADARSAVHEAAAAAGARFESRDGWQVPAGYSTPEAEREVCREAVGWADVSQLGKLELQGPGADLAAIAEQVAGVTLTPGSAARAAGAWWCAVTPERVLVLADAAQTGALRERLTEATASRRAHVGLCELTTAHGALVVAGPEAREVIARFCALDLRPAVTPIGAFRPGSIARTPGYLLREGRDRFLLLFGWALGEYVWTVVADAAGARGGAPVALDAVAAVEEAVLHA